MAILLTATVVVGKYAADTGGATDAHGRKRNGGVAMMKREAGRAIALAVLATLAPSRSMVCLAAASEQAPEIIVPQTYDLDIPRAPLELALKDFCRQTGLLYGYFPARPNDPSFTTRRHLRGSFTANQAITELLRGSGLLFDWTNANTFSISEPARPKAVSRSKKKKPRRLAREQRHEHTDVESIIVSSTRLSDIRSEYASVTITPDEEFNSFGVSTLGELISYLPQMPFVPSPDSRPTGEQYANLRGLGSGTTLVLINGRRIGGTATSYDTGNFDLNAIPITAIQDIEVRHDSPSLRMGGDAVGGVINILLKDHSSKPEVSAHYGQASGGADERRLSVSGGISRGDFRGFVALDAFYRGDLLGVERDFARNQDFRPRGGQDWRSIDAPPGNVRSWTGANLPGLESSFAAVPLGSDGIGLTPADLNAGQRNFASPNSYRSVVPAMSRTSVIALGKLEPTAGIVAFGEFMAIASSTDFQLGPPTLSGALVPASNPFNPFDEPVIVNTTLEAMPARKINADSKFGRAVAGIQIDWRDWDVETAAVWTREEASLHRQNELDPLRVMNALAASDMQSALNPFGSGIPQSRPGSPPGAPTGIPESTPAGDPRRLSLSLQIPPTDYTAGASQVYARAIGPVASVPAGDVALTTGAEWRREQLSTPALAPSRDVSSAFAEIRLPIVHMNMEIPGIWQLAISGGVRVDDVGQIGALTTWQGGLLWNPAPVWTVRGAYSTSFRPPALYELHAPAFSFPATIADPKRNDELTNVIVTGGGNPKLKSSTGNSWSFGIAYDHFENMPANDFHVELNYWRISLRDPVAAIPVSIYAGHDELFAGRVTRALPTNQDIEAGLPGALRALDVSAGNFGRTTTSGIDLRVAADWRTNFGRFRPEMNVVWTDLFETMLVAGLSADNRVGVASGLGSVPRWRATAQLDWMLGTLVLTPVARFAGAYDDVRLATGERTGREIPSAITLDLQLAYRTDAPASIWDAVTLTAGVANVLDDGPSFAEVGAFAGYDVSQGNLRQRFFYGRLTKKF